MTTKLSHLFGVAVLAAALASSPAALAQSTTTTTTDPDEPPPSSSSTTTTTEPAEQPKRTTTTTESTTTTTQPAPQPVPVSPEEPRRTTTTHESTTTTTEPAPSPPPTPTTETVVDTTQTLSARRNEHRSVFGLSFSLGGGVLINPNTNIYARRSTSATPLSLELMPSFELAGWATIDVGFVFAYDAWDSRWYASPQSDTGTRAYYVGARPGMRFFTGNPESGTRGYFRAAIPLQYDNASNVFAYGFLAGFGFEAKAGVAGFFMELDGTFYFNNNNVIPVELRMGLALHF